MFRLLQFLYFSGGIFFFTWACYSSRFHDVEGFLNGKFCLPVSVGISLFILGFAVSGRFKKSAFWFALALVGQAVSLQLIDAGSHCSYQHYKPLAQILKTYNFLFLIYIVVQSMLVIVGLGSIWMKIRAWIARTFKFWQLLGIGLVFFLSSATISQGASRYLIELLFATFIQAVNLATIVLIVWHLPEDSTISLKHKFDKLLMKSETTESSGGVDRFAIIASVWITLLAIVLCIVAYDRHPHIPDEISYLYQAKYLSEGMIAMPIPPVPDAFKMDLMTYEKDIWFSPFQPGWPLMLALGAFFKVPWLVNPILAGLNLLLIYILVRKIYNLYTSRIVVLLLCTSPWFIFMAMNFMGHTFTLTCALGATLAVIWARETGKVKWGWIGGFILGMMSLIRPLDAAIIAVILGLFSIGIGGKRLKYSAIAGLVLGSIIIASAMLPYNKVLTKSWTKLPVMAYFDKYYWPKVNSFGFGPERGGMGWPHDPFPGHGPLDALLNANLNIFSINIELFGWCTGSLVLIAIMLFSRKMRRNDYLMLAVLGLVIGIYTFNYFGGGPDFGARYWYIVIVPCVVLTIRGIQHLSSLLDSESSDGASNGTRVMVGVLILCILSLLNFLPWRAIDKYHHYRGMRPDIRHLAKEHNFGKSLVLIRGELMRDNINQDYPSAAIYNPIDLNSESPVYVSYGSQEISAQLLDAYTDRKIWIVNGPTITGNGYKVIDGPITARGLLMKDMENVSKKPQSENKQESK